MAGVIDAQEKKRVARIESILRRDYPDAYCPLHYSNALEILVATILAAQCTDKRVNLTTPDLFARFAAPADYAAAEQEVLEVMIHSCGFYRNKASAIRNCCAAIVESHGGGVPDTMEQLVALPGIGRKSANLILSCAYNKPGIIVDTHVKRISFRLGLSTNTNPDKIEIDLNKVIVQKERALFSYRVADHGRAVCLARSPRCAMCSLAELCPSAIPE